MSVTIKIDIGVSLWGVSVDSTRVGISLSVGFNLGMRNNAKVGINERVGANATFEVTEINTRLLWGETFVCGGMRWRSGEVESKGS